MNYPDHTPAIKHATLTPGITAEELAAQFDLALYQAEGIIETASMHWPTEDDWADYETYLETA